MAILRIRDKDGKMVEITAIKGDKGDPGNSGVYVGSGDMPEGYNVQVDPTGEVMTEKPWVLIESTTLKEALAVYKVTLPANTYKEVWVDGEWTISTTATSASTQRFIIGRNGNIINDRQTSVSNGTKLYYRAHGKLSPFGTILYEVSISTSKYTSGTLSLNAGDMSAATFTHIPEVMMWIASGTHLFGVGSTFKIWGR